MKKKNKTDDRHTRRDFDTGCGRATCMAETRAACESDELRARREGAALLNRMRGRGWKLEVWENLGWHYAVYSGALSVHVSKYMGGPPKYWTLMSSVLPPRGQSPGGGSALWHDAEHKTFADPNRAVQHQLGLAQAVLADLTRTVMATVASQGGR